MGIEYVASNRLDAQSLQSMGDDLRHLADAHDDITVDMSGVEYIDSSGVGALVYLFKRSRAHRKTIRIVNLSGQPKKLLDELKLTRIIRN